MNDASVFSVKKALPNFKALGPKFGKNAARVAEVVRSFDENIIEQLLSEKSYALDKNAIKGSVTLDDVEVVTESRDGLIVQCNGDMSIALDITLTDGLLREGLVREFINRIQNMRKEAGFEVTDRIILSYTATPDLARAIAEHETHIQSETLAVSLGTPFEAHKFSRSWEFSGQSVEIGIEKMH